jgi:hypothetical protein
VIISRSLPTDEAAPLHTAKMMREPASFPVDGFRKL